jgi:hypothetical protein
LLLSPTTFSPSVLSIFCPPFLSSLFAYMQAKVGDLKEYLKAHKQPQAGEKDDLVSRVTMHVASRALKIDDKDPFELKPAELRKACAQRGLNPMGERDELLKLLIESAQSGDGGGSSSGGGGGGGGGDASDDEATKIVKRVLDLEGDSCAILSLLGTEVSSSSSVAVMRKQVEICVICSMKFSKVSVL